MKKVFILLMSVLLSITIAFPAYASTEVATSDILTVSDSTELIQTDDGGYISVTLVSNSVQTRSTDTKQGEKYVTKYDSDGNVLWKYTISASFSYVYGQSSVCTDATYSVENNSSIWYFSNGSTEKSENVAHGYGKFEQKMLGLIVVETVNIDISITCDIYGNLS